MKPIPLKYLPVLGILMLFVLIGFYLIKAGREDIEAPVATDLVPEEGIRLENIHYIQDNPEEGAKWVLDANEVRFSEDRQHISFNDFHLKLEPENSIFIELVGNSGDYDKASNEINLRGNLKGNTGNGYNIFTGHILYKQKDGYLKTDDLVEIKGPFFSVKGKGLFVNLANETIKIMKDVVTSIEGESLIL